MQVTAGPQRGHVKQLTHVVPLKSVKLLAELPTLAVTEAKGGEGGAGGGYGAGGAGGWLAGLVRMPVTVMGTVMFVYAA